MYIVISLLTDFLMHGHRYMYFVTFSTCGHFIYISLPQPKMYQKIAKHEQIMKKYADVLKSDKVVSEEDYAVSLQHFLRKVKNNRRLLEEDYMSHLQGCAVFCPGYLEWWLDSNLHLVLFTQYILNTLSVPYTCNI